MMKLLLVLGIALLLIRFRYELWIVLLIASLSTALLYGLEMRPLLVSLLRGAVGLPTIELIVAIYLIATLGEALSSLGYFTRLIEALENAFRDIRLVLAIPPVLLGLLPMPAGAMMSAPIVGEVGARVSLSAEEKTFINFWFRHIWEYAWPLYPGVILISALLGVRIERIVALQSPLVLVSLILGLVYLFRRVSRPLPRDQGRKERTLLSLLISVWPILGIVCLVLILKVELIISLSAILVAVFLFHRVDVRSILSHMVRGARPRTFLLLCAVMIFKEVLDESGGVGAFSQVQGEAGIVAIVSLCSIPFIVGLLTGVTAAFVGVATPIFLHLLKANLNLVFLLYLCGFAGVLLSPTHLCFVVTKDYFKADLVQVYRRLLPLVVLLVVIGFFIAYLRQGSFQFINVLVE
ncbi:hypothetical protein AMJ40_05365 [candidate division TA06 bacterium DG_26]|uniref:DUF401 family protein n=1 Tax=candidate division TA06 bacterium DG_26 TaxID=1703771 RepID=A0A0S7WH72_UNCT6|nr:MAG: hypothetical protein AMJ40_05365 [candidate division TA06 bacterium DG_26]